MSDQAIKVSGTVGMRVPCYSCAPGKSILAKLPEEEFDNYLEGVTLKSFTSRTLHNRELLSADLQRVRECGYAIDEAEGLEESIAWRLQFLTTIFIQSRRLRLLLRLFACLRSASKTSVKPVSRRQRPSEKNCLIEVIK